MSLSTPSKESRIERHLMRQRGAGTRAITADFGFSFAPLILPGASSIEPPAKRRKTVVNKGTKDASLETRKKAAADDTTAITIPVASAVETGRQPRDEAAQKDDSLVAAGVAWIAGPQIVRETQSSNLASSRALSPRFEAGMEHAPLDAARIDVRGTTMPDQTGAASTRASNYDTGVTKKVETRPITTRAPTTRKKATLAGDASAVSASDGGNVDDSFVAGLKPRKKAAKRAKKEALEPVLEDTRPNAMQQTLEVVDYKQEPSHTKKRAVKKRTVKDFDDPKEVPASPFTDRPRRKTATTAIQKVSMGFEQETFSVDKLRRATEPTKPARQRRQVEAVLLDKPLLAPVDDGQPAGEASRSVDTETRTITVPLERKKPTRNRKAPAKRANPVEVSAKLSAILGDEWLEQEIHTVTGRTPKPIAPVTKELPKLRQKRSIAIAITGDDSPVAKTTSNSHRGKGPDMVVKASNEAEEALSDTRHVKSQEADAFQKPAMSTSSKPVAKRKRRLQASDDLKEAPEVGYAPSGAPGDVAFPNKRRALAQTDGNIVRPSISPEKPGHKSDSARTIVDVAPSASNMTQKKSSPLVKPDRSSKPRRRIAADDDWRSAAPDAKLQRAPAARKADAKSRSGVARRLDTIAGFVA